MDIIKEIMLSPDSFSPRSILLKGWGTTKKYWSKAVMLILIDIALTIVSSAIMGLLANSPLLAALIMALVIVAQIAFGVVMIRFMLKAVDDEPVVIRDLLKFKWAVVPRYFVTMILVACMVIAGLIVFVLPGIYFAITYLFAQYLVVDKGLKPFEALKESKRITRKHIFDLFSYGVVACALVLLLIVPAYYIIAVGAALGGVLVITGGTPIVTGILALIGVTLIVLLIVGLIAAELTYAFGLVHIYRKLSAS